jgi:hypothetical protein
MQRSPHAGLLVVDGTPGPAQNQTRGHQYDDFIGAKQLNCTDPAIASSGGGGEDAYNIDLSSGTRIVTGQTTTDGHGGILGSGTFFGDRRRRLSDIYLREHPLAPTRISIQRQRPSLLFQLLHPDPSEEFHITIPASELP